MDDSFPLEFWHSDLFWLDSPISIPDPVRQTSAFVPYLSRSAIGSQLENNPTATTSSSTGGKVHKRVIEYWRKQWYAEKAPAAVGGELEREKCHRHMLNERMRREKQRHSYSALHSLLPTKTKNDKNSIIQMAARTMQELKGLEGMLKRRNSELEMAIEAKKKKTRENENETTPIRVALSNPSSAGINSMLVVLNFLKTGGLNAKAIHATFLNSHFSAQLAIDTTVPLIMYLHVSSFVSFSPHSSISIMNADGTPMILEGVGSVVTSTISIPDVFYIPNFALNLVSVSQLCQFDFLVSFSSSSYFVQDHRSQKVIGTGRRQG